MTTKHPIPDELLIDHLAILAKTGAGKTYGAKSVVERLAQKKRRICAQANLSTTASTYGVYLAVLRKFGFVERSQIKAASWLFEG